MPAPQPIPLKRAERTRLALVNAGRKLFATQAPEGVTIDDIVAAAAVSKGSFYTYFSDRDALLEAIVREIRTTIEDGVGVANAGVEDPARRIARAVCVYLRFSIDEKEQAGVLSRMHERRNPVAARLNAGLIEDVRDGLSRGRLAVATVESGVLFVLGVTQAALVATLRETSAGGVVAIAQQLCALLLRGFGLDRSESEAIAAQAADEIVSRKLPA